MQKDVEQLIELQEMKEVDWEAATRFQAYLVKRILDVNPFDIVEIKDNYIGIALGQASENTDKKKRIKLHSSNTSSQSMIAILRKLLMSLIRIQHG